MKYIRLVVLLMYSLTFYGQGLKTNDDYYASVRQKVKIDSASLKLLPKKVDLTKYVPSVIDQGVAGTCVAVSTTYYLRTILEAIKRNITKKRKIDELAFSASYVYNEIKVDSIYDKDAKDSIYNDCVSGTYFEDAFELLKNKGVLKHNEQGYPFCKENLKIPVKEDSKILDYIRLFSLIDAENKVGSTKKALWEKSPVVVGLQTTINIEELDFLGWIWHKISSFFGFEDKEFGLWKPKDSDLSGGHAVCIVAYDDKKFGSGAFKAVNSRGKYWGDDGFFWIRYIDYERLAKQAFQAYLPENGKKGEGFSGEVAFVTNSYESENEEYIDIFNARKGDDTLTAFKLKYPQPHSTIYRYKVRTNNLTFLYVLDENKHQGVTGQVFPLEYDELNMSELLGANTNFVLPQNKNVIWHLIGPLGTEYAVFLFSKEKLDITKYYEEMNQLKGLQFAQKILKVFGEKLVPLSNIEFDNRDPRKMKFILKNNEKGVIVPLLVKYEHVAAAL